MCLFTIGRAESLGVLIRNRPSRWWAFWWPRRRFFQMCLNTSACETSSVQWPAYLDRVSAFLSTTNRLHLAFLEKYKDECWRLVEKFQLSTSFLKTFAPKDLRYTVYILVAVCRAVFLFHFFYISFFFRAISEELHASAGHHYATPCWYFGVGQQNWKGTDPGRLLVVPFLDCLLVGLVH